MISSTPSTPALGAAAMIGAGLIFAAINVLTQWLTQAFAVPSPTLVFWQYGLALLPFLPGLIRAGRASLATHHFGLHVVRVVLATLGVQCFVLSLAHVPIWQVIALDMTSPFLVVIGAGLFLGERVGVARLGAVAVGFLGATLILAPWEDRFSLYSLLPVGAAAFWAASSLLTKQLTQNEGATSVTVYLLALLTPINAAFAALQVPASPLQGFALSGGTVLLTVGVLALLTAAAQYLLTAAYARADAAFLQTFDYVRLPVNVLAGLAVFGYAPSGYLWPGAALILAASVWLLQMDRTEPKPATA